MKNVVIKKLHTKDEIPYDLLYLSDPSINIIKEYINRGDCYVACIGNDIIGAYVLIKTRPLTLELVNIAVKESYQGMGIGKQLIYSAIDLARKENAKVIEIGTGNSSIYQLALYQN